MKNTEKLLEFWNEKEKTLFPNFSGFVVTFEAIQDIVAGEPLRLVEIGDTMKPIGIALESVKKGEPVRVAINGIVPVRIEE